MAGPGDSNDKDRAAFGADGPLAVPSAASSHCTDSPTQALLQAVDEFNRQLFFEQHETLEDAWIEEEDSIRYLYQGILQIGVGFYHLLRGNYAGATALMRRGMDYLEPFSPACMSVDVARLLTETERARSELVRLGPEQLHRFDRQLIPTVRLIGRDRGGARCE